MGSVESRAGEHDRARVVQDPLPDIERLIRESGEDVSYEQHEALCSLFEEKIAFLQSKLAPQAFIDTRGNEVLWNTVVGLTRLSPRWKEDHPDHDLVWQFIENAKGQGSAQDDEEYPDMDPNLPGIRYTSYALHNIPQFRVGEDSYQFAYRQYKVVDPDEIPEEKWYKVGPIGTIYHEVGVMKLSNE